MTAGFAYDRAGNVLNDGTNDYWYNAEGQLCAVYKSGGTVTAYSYDAEGRRVAKGTLGSYPGLGTIATTSVATTGSCGPITASTSGFTLGSRYLVDLVGDQVTELNGSGNWQHSNVFAGGKLLATWDSTGIHFPLTDPLGTKRIQASNLGTVDLTCIGLPFGNGPGCTGADTSPLGTEHRFTEKERDTESGNDYFGARYYASTMGRFMSPDWSPYPMAVPYLDFRNPQSLNLFIYALNNPLNRYDLDGHDWRTYVQKARQWAADHPRTIFAAKAVGALVVTATAVAAIVVTAPVAAAALTTAAIVTTSLTLATETIAVIGASSAAICYTAAAVTGDKGIAKAASATLAVTTPSGFIGTIATDGNTEAGELARSASELASDNPVEQAVGAIELTGAYVNAASSQAGKEQTEQPATDPNDPDPVVTSPPVPQPQQDQPQQD